jgi:hypothetical protein
MVVLLIEAVFSIHFNDHTIRVLYRLGVSQLLNELAAVEAARRLKPEYPGAVDGLLWDIGCIW